MPIRFIIIIILLTSTLLGCQKEKTVRRNIVLPSANQTKDSQLKIHHDVETDEYYFDSEAYGDFSPEGNWDARIVQINKNTAERSVLIESTRKTAQLVEWNEFLSPFAFSKEKQTLFLRGGLEGTHNCNLCDIWKYNLETKTLTFVEFQFLSEAKNTKTISFFTALTVDDGLGIIRAGYLTENDTFNGEARYLLLYNLKNETVTLLVKLPKNETLNASYYALSEHFDFSLIDKNTLEYGVFDQTQAQPEEYIEKPLIEKRIIHFTL